MNVSELCPSLRSQILGNKHRNATRTTQVSYPRAKNNS